MLVSTIAASLAKKISCQVLMSPRMSQYQIVCFFVCLFSFSVSYAQPGEPKSFSQQLSLTNDNDRYLFQGKDGYYTNGLAINYTRVKKNKKSNNKQVNDFEIGQKLYTPYSRKIYVPSQIDRPVTGYLYGKFTRSNFLKSNQLWQWGISVGTIGKASQGRALQNMFHKIINVNSDWWGWIWEYELKSEPGLNLHSRYAIGLLDEKSTLLQITPVTQATLGSNFTNISQGLLFQFGKLNLLSQSSYWNATVQHKELTQSNKTEVFFYYHPEIMYQLYNATVQGGMFRKDKGPITCSIEAFVVTHQLGALLSVNRYTLKIETTFRSKEASSQRFNQKYGSVHVAYRFS
jgi:lipid A 3-O-deacylase